MVSVVPQPAKSGVDGGGADDRPGSKPSTASTAANSPAFAGCAELAGAGGLLLDGEARGPGAVEIRLTCEILAAAAAADNTRVVARHAGAARSVGSSLTSSAHNRVTMMMCTS